MVAEVFIRDQMVVLIHVSRHESFLTRQDRLRLRPVVRRCKMVLLEGDVAWLDANVGKMKLTKYEIGANLQNISQSKLDYLPDSFLIILFVIIIFRSSADVAENVVIHERLRVAASPRSRRPSHQIGLRVRLQLVFLCEDVEVLLAKHLYIPRLVQMLNLAFRKTLLNYYFTYFSANV